MCIESKSKLLQVMYCKYCNVYCKLSDCKKKIQLKKDRKILMQKKKLGKAIKS